MSALSLKALHDGLKIIFTFLKILVQDNNLMDQVLDFKFQKKVF
jgi:hypothetical protein